MRADARNAGGAAAVRRVARRPPRLLAAIAGAALFAAPAAADTVAVARDDAGAALLARCPEAPRRAIVAGHPVPMPAVPSARLFRYRLDGAPPAVGAMEPDPLGAALRFRDGAWMRAGLVEIVLPVAWQRLAFAPEPDAAGRCGAPPPAPEKRALMAAIQRGLAAHGLDPGRTDGVYAAATGAAIRAWQAYWGPLVDGVPSAALRDRLAAAPAGPGVPALRAFAAQIERRWRPPAWARGAWRLVAPLRLRIGAGGAILSAEAEIGAAGGDRRIARTAEDAALAAGRLPGAPPGMLRLRLAKPVSAIDREYARRVARRLARHRALIGLPPAAPGGRAALVRLHVDGDARTIRMETLDRGALSDAALARIGAAVAGLPRLPPPPAGGGPAVFAMDIALFARPPRALPGRSAFSDWPAD